MKQHKWHKEIKAWADGQTIEFRFKDTDNDWEVLDFECPNWYYEPFEYRIKPQLKDKNEVFKQIQEHIELNMYGHAWDKCQEMIEKSEEKPQPKEPQYFYVWRNHKGEVRFYDPTKLCECPIEYKYIGKIKLEESDK